MIALSLLTLPKASDESSQDSQELDPLIFRINAARLFVTALDHLVSLFLAERMGDHYERDIVPQITAWMVGKNQKQGSLGTPTMVH